MRELGARPGARGKFYGVLGRGLLLFLKAETKGRSDSLDDIF